MLRAAVLLACVSLSACGERPIRDFGDVVDVSSHDASTDRVEASEVGVSACVDGGAREVPTTLTAAGLCTSRATGRWCDGDALRTCGTRAGEAEPLRVACDPGERCVMRGARGGCERVGSCHEGATRCESGTQLARCVGGAWSVTGCAVRCAGDALGAMCVDGGPTAPLRGALRYGRRVVANDLLSWGGVETRAARGFAIRYLRGDAVLARGVTDASGAFVLEAPTAREPGDRIEAVAALGVDGRAVIMVGDPGAGAGMRQTFGDDTSGGTPWRWQWEVPGDGGALTIPMESAEGASVFDDLASAWSTTRARMQRAPSGALAVWVKRGVSWDCGACFSELLPVRAAGQRFDGQLWISGDASEGWWSPAVTLHEFGHWVMSAWGVIPHEGGAHFLGVPSFPGLAWSEGWASWVSSDLRDDPRHYAVAGGTFFWWDIARREIYNGATWPRPNPDASLLQSIDENEVSAILWSLRADPAVGPARAYGAITSPRMTLAPFARCNTQRYASRMGVCTSGEPAPHLADFLDALRCDGVSERSVGVAAGTYPYPAARPRCEVGCAAGACETTPSCRVGAPISLRANEIGDGLVELRLAQPGDLGAPAVLSIELPPGVRRAGGPMRWEVPRRTDGRWVVRLEAPSARAGSMRAAAEVRSAWAGARAVARWTGAVPGANNLASPPVGASSAP